MPAKTTKKKPKKKAARRSTPKKTPGNGARRPLQEEVRAALSSLKKMSTPRDRENLARFGIT
ncbi:MAG: hypothetical protein ACREMQ_09405, partial [Longimicrobiales bacterium]